MDHRAIGNADAIARCIDLPRSGAGKVMTLNSGHRAHQIKDIVAQQRKVANFVLRQD